MRFLCEDAAANVSRSGRSPDVESNMHHHRRHPRHHRYHNHLHHHPEPQLMGSKAPGPGFGHPVPRSTWGGGPTELLPPGRAAAFSHLVESSAVRMLCVFVVRVHACLLCVQCGLVTRNSSQLVEPRRTPTWLSRPQCACHACLLCM